LPAVRDLKAEIFGPVLHVVRWRGEPEGVVREVNALGYGLTFGIQTRIDSRAERLAKLAHIGNVYVNRNMIGAVVGVQPFGGEGLSGTGPKAGGPNYLLRFTSEGGAASELRSMSGASAASVAPSAEAVATVRAAVDALAGQGSAWAANPPVERARWLVRAAEAVDDPAIARAWRLLASHAERELAAQPLPGPTGESNELRLHGRGVFAFVGDTSAPAPSLASAVAAALVAGDTVAWVAEESLLANARGWLDALRRAGLPADALRTLSGSFSTLGTALVADARVAGVCALDDARLPALARQLAAQEGAIVPLLSLAEAARPLNLYRFCAEQTVTINTAAAGGNAALLAGLH
jgi:RHH-type proline utilization regulon transcriptional repressor/proline dehydrogenase/delta 1-pyrroline-5-carboxylate dehydrogenase